MNKIPTAKILIRENNDMESLSLSQEHLMIRFAQLHVEAALKAAAEKAMCLGEDDKGNHQINKYTILNAYPKELIQ